MDTYLDTTLGAKYKSKSQMARVITENWVKENMYCPRCHADHLLHLQNNRAVADFQCPDCGNIIESKAKMGHWGRTLNDGEYHTLIRRIHETDNPDFLIMYYDPEVHKVNELTIIPKHYFIDRIIKRRPPLSPKAKRAGWEGSHVLLDQIPNEGKIAVIKDTIIIPQESVRDKYHQTEFLAEGTLSSRGWILDTLNCLSQIHKDVFTLADAYAFEESLRLLHPKNQNIRPKICQQLQFLRDKGFLEFVKPGVYRKLHTNPLS